MPYAHDKRRVGTYRVLYEDTKQFIHFLDPILKEKIYEKENRICKM